MTARRLQHLPSPLLHTHQRAYVRMAGSLLLSMMVAGCNTLGSSGPNGGAIRGVASKQIGVADVRVIDLTDDVARQLLLHSRQPTFADVLGDGQAEGITIGSGDVLDISIWESPPAALFGMLGGTAPIADVAALETAKKTDMPQQMVDGAGMLSLPFVGTIKVAGKTPRQIQIVIAEKLRGIANKPQVIVGIVRNANSNVTVIGKVAASGRVPLTPRGERLLDVLAVSGGVTERLERTTIQITRASSVVAMPIESVIRDPRQNIRLQRDDVVTAIYQPYSFTALGAVRAPSEVDFVATGITLSQALGRIGGLEDSRADVKGAFVFRFENPAHLDPALVNSAHLTPDGKVPVVYRVNLGDPRSFFLAQNFGMQNRDILYVSNAPGADLQKFIGIISQTAFSIIGISNAVTGN